MHDNNYQIYLGDILLGNVTNIDTDMPNVGGDFTETTEFEKVKPDFDKEFDLLNAETETVWLGVMEELDRKGLKIIKPNGVKLRFSNPSARKRNGFAHLHIKDGKAWWRPT